MRILVVSPFSPFPATDGGRIRVSELVKGLAEHHDVDVLAMDEHDRRSATATTAATIGALLSGRSVNGALPSSRAFRHRLGERLADGRFDTVQCEYSSMAAYRRPGDGPPWVLDAHNVEHRLHASLADQAGGARRMAYRAYARREARRRRREERAAWRSVDHVVTVSEVDRRLVLDDAPDIPVTVVPNGVDLDRLTFAGDRGERPPSAVFVGKMDYRPNVDAVRWFVAEILPEVLRRVPSFELTIVGSKPPPAVRALAGRPGVRVTGAVDDPVPFVRAAAVAVVPIRARSGTRLKVLEALAAGTPVVSTAAGVEGIDVDHGHHVLVADDAASFAGAVSRLLADRDEGRRMARAGRRLVEECYGWPAAVRTLVGVHEQLAASVTR